jgi:hypothetical protein
VVWYVVLCDVAGCGDVCVGVVYDVVWYVVWCDLVS